MRERSSRGRGGEKKEERGGEKKGGEGGERKGREGGERKGGEGRGDTDEPRLTGPSSALIVETGAHVEQEDSSVRVSPLFVDLPVDK